MSGLLRASGDGALRLTVRVTPRGGRDALDGVAMDADGRPYLKLRVSAPPSDGAANKAVTALLAKALGAPKSAVTVVSGHSARVKQIEIASAAAADRETLEKRLAERLGGG